MYYITKIKNGMTVASCPVENAKSVAIGVWVGVGGRYEQKDKSGISHFVEHMLFKGTRTRTYRQIKESIEGLGGLLNAFTSEEVTCYMAKVLPLHTENTLDVLIDMVTDPLLQSSDIAKERSVIFEEIKMYYDLPHHLAYDNLIRLMWPEHALGRNLAGTFESLERIDRKAINMFMDKYYGSPNILIAACGNITHDQLVGQLEKILKKRGKKQKNRQAPDYALFDRRQKAPRADFLKKDTQQTHLCLGIHALKRKHHLKYALTLMHVILGANMSSRLFNELREKNGYAYEVATTVKRYRETGAFFVHAGVLTDKTEKALSIILRQLKKLTKVRLPHSELRRAKVYCRGQLLMGLEDTLDHMNWFAEAIMKNGKPEHVEDVIAAIDRISADDIQSLAGKIFHPENFNLSVVGPVDDDLQTELTDLLKGF